MRRMILLNILGLVFLLCSCEGGLSSIVVHAKVDSAIIPLTIIEGETLEVEVLVIMEGALDTFSHFSNDVDTENNAIRIRPYVRENRSENHVPVTVITHEFARFDGLTPGEWDVHVDGTDRDVDQTVTVVPES